MSERYFGHGEAAVGTNKTGLNLFNTPATPTTRGRIYDLIVGCEATPADQATDFKVGRTTAVGTEGSGFTPVNLDDDGPASNYDLGVAHSAEPTYTSNKELLQFSLNQRATFRWVAAPGGELLLPATQNAGAGLKSSSATGTATHQYAMYFLE
jgi:hypothetical protein